MTAPQLLRSSPFCARGSYFSLIEAHIRHKPFDYPWGCDFWKRQVRMHWIPEEVPLDEACRDWTQIYKCNRFGRASFSSRPIH